MVGAETLQLANDVRSISGNVTDNEILGFDRSDTNRVSGVVLSKFVRFEVIAESDPKRTLGSVRVCRPSKVGAAGRF